MTLAAVVLSVTATKRTLTIVDRDLNTLRLLKSGCGFVCHDQSIKWPSHYCPKNSRKILALLGTRPDRFCPGVPVTASRT